MTKSSTKSFRNTGIYHPNYSLFSGELTIEDFNTSFPNKKRISNQAEAAHLQAGLDIGKKVQMKIWQYQHMTLEELRKMKLISNTDGRPCSTLTNQKWQKEFTIRKAFIVPYKKDVKTLKSTYSQESGKWNNTQSRYYGCTGWQTYCAFINDVLKNIRSGQIDYCYYIFQIMDLLKFHYDDLRTRYCDGYWEIWLEK
ncbi:hypothetical protein AALB16_15905 [Lachnospiraceae bacterium 62-35]